MRVTKGSIVVLKQDKPSITGTIEELEKKYSEKFGCKVIILESNLEIVDVVNDITEEL